MGNKILLVCYVFPPYPGVGGRRWAKFAKYLAEAGYELEVIAAENPLNEESVWINDIQHPNIHVHRLPGGFPQILLKQPARIFQKIQYRFWQKIFSIYSKGFAFERTLFWRKKMQKKAEELIRNHGIETVIATGPPFLHLQSVVRLKKIFPSLKVLVDLRDPWTDNKSFMGFKDMPADRFAFEKETETEVMQNADAVTTVADHMTETLRAKNPGRESHFFTVTNGYDPAEVKVAAVGPVDSKLKSDKMRFVYTGSLYPSIEYVFIPFADSLVKIRNTNPELYLKLSFDFYGSAATEMREIIEERNLNDIVKMKGWVSAAEIGKEIESADACLLFFAADHAFSMNTKLFEYLARKKPVVLFSNPGETPDFLHKNKLGFAISPEKADEELNRIIAMHFDSGLQIDSDFDLSTYSVPAISHQLIRIIEQLKSGNSVQ